ncbi:hypothetical protein K1719_033692 [Acacia pycnantha]|nr:hypothetical protein K1719_033692 [Acacia pycnantha]
MPHLRSYSPSGFCFVLRPEIVWQQSWKLMSDDIQYRHEQETGFILSKIELENAVSLELERLLNDNGRSLRDYESMPFPASPNSHGRANRYMYDELNFDINALRREPPVLVANLTEQQKEIYMMRYYLSFARGCREDIVLATINGSYLWQHCKVFKLTKNLILIHSDVADNTMATKEFAYWIMAIRDGAVPTIDVQSTYPDLLDHLGDGEYFKDRAILTPNYMVVDEVNSYIIDMLPGDERVYLRADSVSRHDVLRDSIAAMHSVEFLNTTSMSGVPVFLIIS